MSHPHSSRVWPNKSLKRNKGASHLNSVSLPHPEAPLGYFPFNFIDSELGRSRRPCPSSARASPPPSGSWLSAPPTTITIPPPSLSLLPPNEFRPMPRVLSILGVCCCCCCCGSGGGPHLQHTHCRIESGSQMDFGASLLFRLSFVLSPTHTHSLRGTFGSVGAVLRLNDNIIFMNPNTFCPPPRPST